MNAPSMTSCAVYVDHSLVSWVLFKKGWHCLRGLLASSRETTASSLSGGIRPNRNRLGRAVPSVQRLDQTYVVDAKEDRFSVVRLLFSSDQVATFQEPLFSTVFLRTDAALAWFHHPAWAIFDLGVVVCRDRSSRMTIPRSASQLTIIHGQPCLLYHRHVL